MTMIDEIKDTLFPSNIRVEDNKEPLISPECHIEEVMVFFIILDNFHLSGFEIQLLILGGSNFCHLS